MLRYVLGLSRFTDRNVHCKAVSFVSLGDCLKQFKCLFRLLGGKYGIVLPLIFRLTSNGLPSQHLLDVYFMLDVHRYI